MADLIAPHIVPPSGFRCSGCVMPCGSYVPRVTCRECGDTFCEGCMLPSSLGWLDGRAWGVCHGCASFDVLSILSMRERRFVTNLKSGQSGEDAARRSGYLAPAEDAERLLQTEKIKAALAVRR